MEATSDAGRIQRWREFLSLTSRRIGMYTMTESLAGTFALLVGFDEGIGGSVINDFQHWMSARHPENPALVSADLVLHELTGDHDLTYSAVSVPPDLTIEASQKMLQLFTLFLDERELQAPG